ncbi:redoxin domain-containing protein, partial [Myxococcota bacterium]|nr:redoxin domain-containing protein [Myxococcota bacterium]
VAAPAVVQASVQASGAGAGLEKAKAEGVLSFLFLAFLAGLGALVTPCVFPAIPLTVSFFSKYSEEGFGRGARLAAVYAATMVATFTVAGVLISVFFGVTGVQDFAAHPLFNLVLALTLVFFAMNLLGWFEIGVPGFVLAFVNKLESSYGRNAILGDDASTKRSGMTDYVVVVVAAITATTVFFTCTVAFVGIVLVAAAKGEWFWPTIGMLAFSSAFALPFFLLAMFPQAAHRLRGKSGSWLTATRVTLGFLELAAAMKFLSNADLVWQLGLVTRDLVLALWIPLFALAGLFLLGKLKLGEDVTGGAEEHPSVPRVLASTVMFGLSIYLAAGLFNGRPFGGWIDGWLPPVVYPGKAAPVMAGAGGAQPAGHAFAWETDLSAGRARAQREQKLVFVNYTGYTCTNCRYMEGAVFPLPEIAGLLNGMVLVELYTDGGTPEQDRNRDDQVKRFNTAALPLYSVERADGTVLGTFASSTNDPAEFRRFLEEAIAMGKGATPVLANGEGKVVAPATAEPALVLRAQRLSDGGAAKVVEPGRWTLINFWATWCGPCIEELKEFLVARGRAFEKDGGRFVTIAFDDAADLPKAKALMAELGVAADNALFVPPDATDAVDARFGFDGATLPYTVLVSPTGDVVWKHRAVLSEPELDQKLLCFAAPKGAAAAAPDPKKCTGSAAR